MPFYFMPASSNLYRGIYVVRQNYPCTSHAVFYLEGKDTAALKICKPPIP